MTTDTEETTLLVITGIDIPPFSARGLTQTLAPIDSATSLRRTVNGELLDLSAPEFRKYASEITCRDQQTPAIDGVWPGAEVTVDCVAELAYLSDTDAEPQRESVDYSERTDGDYTFYRPRLTMRVVSLSIEKDEYGAETGWTLRLEEV